MNATTATPAEIDTRLAELHETARKADGIRRATAERARRMVGERKINQGRRRVWATTDDEAFSNLSDALDADKITPDYNVATTREILATAAQAAEDHRAAYAAMQDLDAEYDRRPWSRFFTVPGGHIHSGTVCAGGTIRPTTLIGWNPQLSGQTEAEAVAKLGPNLCSHCFPTAPVAWTQGDAKPAECPGSRTSDFDRATARMGYYTGNYGTCNQCGTRVTLTKTNNLRAHKPKD